MGIFSKKENEGESQEKESEGTSEEMTEAQGDTLTQTEVRDKALPPVDDADPKAALSKVYAGHRINVYAEGKGFRWKIAAIGEPKEVAVSAKESCFAAQREIDKLLRRR